MLSYRESTGSFRLLLLAAFLLPGCGTSPPPDSQPAALPLAGTKLRLMVAEDPAIAAAVRQLKDEWNAQTGSELDVREMTERELVAAESLPGDAVICPSHVLGALAERHLLAPVPKALCHEDAGPWSDVFDLLRLHEASWAGQPLAVPFGSPVLCCYYRADLLEKLGRRPPQTWTEYLELAKLLNQPRPAAGGARFGAIEPLGPGWAGLVLLAHAAPYAKHADNYSTLFDIETMEPLVAGPPFVRALEELVQAARSGPAVQLDYDPAAVRAAFWKGQCGMALTWPTAARGASSPQAASIASQPPGGTFQIGFAELPGTTEVYNHGARAWSARPEGSDLQVPLLGLAGRIGVVGAATDASDAAFQLLFWLSGTQLSPRVCAVSPATTLFRRTQGDAPQEWVEKPVSASAADAYAKATQQTLRRGQLLLAPRLPGRGEYLDALDEAVRSAARGVRSPAEALAGAAARWREITNKRGLERQKAAYQHSLGL